MYLCLQWKKRGRGIDYKRIINVLPILSTSHLLYEAIHQDLGHVPNAAEMLNLVNAKLDDVGSTMPAA